MIFEAFKRLREEQPDLAAFLISTGDRAVPISWRQFTDDIAIAAQVVRGNIPGAKIAVLGENSYEWMVIHAACVFSGATVVPIDSNLTPIEIAGRLRKVKASALVYSSLYEEKAHEACRNCPGLAHGGFGTLKTDRYLDAAKQQIRAAGRSIWDESSVDVERVSMIVFTSGTTTEPRGVELTLAGLEVFCDSANRVLPMKPGNHSLMLLPLHHIFGVCTTYLMLMNGVALGICPDFRRIYDAVERFRVNHIFLVPALAEILAQKIQQRGNSAEEALGMPIDWILIGGASLPRRIYEHLTLLGVKMITGYGITETTALYSITPLVGDPHVGAAGKVAASPLVETKISENGELLIKGPCVMKGYFKDKERTAKAIVDGWYHTGDLGRIDDDGFVWITGRASRTIILSSGKKVAPEELEEKLLALPGVREAVVTGEGETRDIRAEVYATVPEEKTRNMIGELNLLLPVYKRIKTIVVRSEPFPRTSSGKIRLG